MKNCKITDNGKNNEIKIGSDCTLTGVSFFFIGDNNSIEIGNNVRINASKQQPVRLNACYSRKIHIGDNSLFSNAIEVHTTDYHNIYDENENLVNQPQDIIIGKHCWIGMRCIILKGTKLADNIIVGANSTVSGVNDNPNVVIAGHPARIISTNRKWEI